MADKKKRTEKDAADTATKRSRSRNAKIAEELANELGSHDQPEAPRGPGYVATLAATEQNTEVPGPSPTEMARRANTDTNDQEIADMDDMIGTDADNAGLSPIDSDDSFAAASLSGTDADGYSEQAYIDEANTGITDSASQAVTDTTSTADLDNALQSNDTQRGSQITDLLEEDDAWAKADKEAMEVLDRDILAGYSTDMEASMEEDIVGVAEGISTRNPQWREDDVKQQTSQSSPIAQADVPNQGVMTSATSVPDAATASDPNGSPAVNVSMNAIPRRSFDQEAASFFRFSGGPFPSLFNARPSSDQPTFVGESPSYTAPGRSHIDIDDADVSDTSPEVDAAQTQGRTVQSAETTQAFSNVNTPTNTPSSQQSPDITVNDEAYLDNDASFDDGVTD